MEQNRDQKREYKIFIVVTPIALLLLYLLFSRATPLHSSQHEEISEELPMVSINTLLENSLSSLEATELLDKRVESFLRRWELKGGSLAIMKDEKLIYAKGYGWADQELEVECEVGHLFRVASLSKLITAVAIMKLVEQRRISLDGKLFGQEGYFNEERYLNFSDKRFKEITVEHLLRHKGGFSIRAGDPLFSLSTIAKREGREVVNDQEKFLQYLLSRRLGYRAGSATHYSNVGYFILSKLIERVTGLEYESYVRDTLLIPNGIYDMHIANNLYHERFENEVKYYEPSNQELVESYFESSIEVPRSYGGNNIKLLQGAGGWVASPVEFLKFITLIDGREGVKDILSKESIEIMTHSTPTTLPIGWTRCNPNGEWSRSGYFSGSSALVKYYRDGYAWVFITNSSSWKGARFSGEINRVIREALRTVAQWPERDLFSGKSSPDIS